MLYEVITGIEADASQLKIEEETELIKLLASWPETVVQASADYNPSLITGYLYELAKTFSIV